MLTPTTPFPFGKFFGQQIQDVPPNYLLWLAKQKWVPNKYPDIMEYIKNRKDELERLTRIAK